MTELYNQLFSEYRNGSNIFLTGSGGVGKTYNIKKLVNELQETKVNYALTATTGVSALSVGGTTLHSWAGVKTGDAPKETLYLNIMGYKKLVTRWKTVQVLIIDEVSMLGKDLFEKLDYIAKKIRYNQDPFGGIQLILTGDFLQLPPVKAEFLFKSKVWKELQLVPIIARIPYRYPDVEFFNLLLRARKGELNDEDEKLLTARKQEYQVLLREMEKEKKEDEEKYNQRIIPTKLFSRKMNVEEENMKELDRIDDKEWVYRCRDAIKYKSKNPIHKEEHYQGILDKVVPPVVILKKGAQVMLTWNIDLDNNLCNGSRGVVLECFDDSVHVKFRHTTQIIKPVIWSIQDDNAEVARCQIPLILCYATSIHKSQSSTMDSVITDLGSTVWGPGLGYVALSRCRTLDGIYLINFWKEKIYPDKEALAFELELEREYTKRHSINEGEEDDHLSVGGEDDENPGDE